MLYPLYWLFILVCTGCWVWHIFVLFPMTNGMMIPNDWHRSRRWLNMAQPPSGTCVSMIIVHPSWSIIDHVYIYCISCVLCIMNIYEHLWTFMNIYEHLWTTLPCCFPRCFPCFLARQLPTVWCLSAGIRRLTGHVGCDCLGPNYPVTYFFEAEMSGKKWWFHEG